MPRDKDYIGLINTMRWQKLRRWKLSRSPLCERCLESGIVTPATEVHHIVPVEDGLTYAEKRRLVYDPSNLRSLCHPCHVETHKEMGRSGRELARRRNERQVAAAVKKFFE